mgnify:CR=1 FL=1
MIDIRAFRKSLSHALRGVSVVYQSEQSFRLQVMAGVLVFFCAFFFRVKTFEWIVLVLLVGSILSLELINSIFERILDTFKPRIHPVVKDIKDIMAGAVLLVSLISVFVGTAIFLPHVRALVRLFS